MLPNFSYVKPGSIGEAVKQLGDKGALVHGGGTDLIGCLRDGIFGAEKLVSLRALNELRGIKETSNGGLFIGAMVTLTEIVRHPAVQAKYAVLAQAAEEVASPQLRHQGTIGGNLCQKPRCWYYRGEFHCLRKGGDNCFAVGTENQYHCILGGENCYIVHPSDTAPALIALNADVEIVGSKGKRSMKVEEFHVPPAEDPTRETRLEQGEIVTAVIVPPPPPGLRSRYRKVSTRRSWDFALAGTALALSFDGDKVAAGRVAFSGAAPIPWRSKEVEEAIVGKTLDEKTIAQAAKAAVAGAEAMEKNAYKIPLLMAVIEEELTAIAKG